jgi:hypothetical protein
MVSEPANRVGTSKKLNSRLLAKVTEYLGVSPGILIGEIRTTHALRMWRTSLKTQLMYSRGHFRG